MRQTVTKTIGKTSYTFEVEGKNLFETLMESQKLSFPNVYKCGLCGSDNLKLNAHAAQDKFKYVTIRCLNHDCRASVNFGQQQQDPNTFYITTKDGTKDYDWQPFVGKDQAAPPQSNNNYQGQVKHQPQNNQNQPSQYNQNYQGQQNQWNYQNNQNQGQQGWDQNQNGQNQNDPRNNQSW